MINAIKQVYDNMSEKGKYYTRVAFLSTGLSLVSAYSCTKESSFLENIIAGAGYLGGAVGLVYAANGKYKEDKEKTKLDTNREETVGRGIW